jgi:hypothetical protein
MACDSAASVNDAHNHHDVVAFKVFVDDDVRRHDGSANIRAELGPGRAAVGIPRQALIEVVEIRIVAVGDVRARVSCSDR